jgi:hypothetical protein
MRGERPYCALQAREKTSMLAYPSDGLETTRRRMNESFAAVIDAASSGRT